MEHASRGRVIAVAGGKGGVGKSIVSVNLAVAMTRLGADVVLLDADLGAPNVHTLFGMTSPSRTLADYLEDRVSDLAEVAVPSGIPKLRLICGGPSVLGSANTSSTSRHRLMSEVGRLDTDCLLMDIGAGVDINAIDFFNGADIRVIVVTPEVTSLQNAYGFLKIAVFRRMQQAVRGKAVADRLGEAFGGKAFEIGSTMDKMSTFFALLESEAPELGEPFRKLIRELNVKIVGNMLSRPNDRDVLFAMQRMIQSFLQLDTEIVGGLKLSHEVRASVNAGKPFALGLPREPNIIEIMKIGRGVLNQDLAPQRKLRRAVSEAFFSDGAGGGVGSGELDTLHAAARSATASPAAGHVEFRPPSQPPRAPIASASVAASAPAAKPAPAAAPMAAVAPPMPPTPPQPPPTPPARVAPPPAATLPTATPTATAAEGAPTTTRTTTLPPAYPTVPPAVTTPPLEMLGHELARTQRASDRLVVNHYIRLRLAGNWHLGAILEVNLGGAELGGIRLSEIEQAEGELQLVAMGRNADLDDGLRVPVRLLSARTDIPGGRLIVEFTDPAAAAAIVAYFTAQRTT